MEEPQRAQAQPASTPLPAHKLADQLANRAGALAERTVSELYRNPFWIERFGERGRRFALEDGRHHVDYLADALRWRSGAIMTQYAAWLQSVLVTRGMCSRHLDEHFIALAAAIRDEFGHAAHDAVTLLDFARGGLRYEEPAARAVQEAAATLADAMSRERSKYEAASSSDDADPSRAPSPDDPEYIVSYLGDAVAARNPSILTDYLAWLAGYAMRHGHPPERLIASIDALRHALDGAADLSAAATTLARATASRA